MQLQTGIHTTQTKRNPQTRILSIGIVVALHIVALYSIVHGFTSGTLRITDPGYIVPVAQPKVDLPPPPPPTGAMKNPETPTAQAPDFQIAPDDNGGGINRTLGNDRGTGINPNPPTTAQGIGATHTIPPYPSLSQRLGEQGTVTLRLAIAADGSIADATVQVSSGSNRLDATAIAWVKAHWRYKPATRDGAPIASTTLAAVKFDLRTAR